MKGAGEAGDISRIKTQTEEIKPVSSDDRVIFTFSCSVLSVMVRAGD